jgi:hypothetical protein
VKKRHLLVDEMTILKWNLQKLNTRLRTDLTAYFTVVREHDAEHSGSVEYGECLD